jgi:hypothetical protein
MVIRGRFAELIALVGHSNGGGISGQLARGPEFVFRALSAMSLLTGPCRTTCPRGAGTVLRMKTFFRPDAGLDYWVAQPGLGRGLG